MFCKYCGASINEASAVCPSCGKQIETEGGVGFWDLVESPKKECFTDTINHEITPSPSTLPVLDKPQKRYVWPFWVLSMLAFAFLTFVCLLLNSKTEKLEVLLESQQKQLQSLSVLEEKLIVLEAENAAMSDRLDSVTAELDKMDVLAFPADETREPGFKSQEGHYLFRFMVDGQPQLFRWEKKEEDGSWCPLIFDKNGRNSELGLSLNENISEGFTSLVAVGLTEQSAGEYRCVAISTSGKELLATVRLNIEKKLVEPSLTDKLDTFFGRPRQENVNNNPDMFSA